MQAGATTESLTHSLTQIHTYTLLCDQAIRHGQVAVVQQLVASGASVNFHDEQWLSPLHIAAGVRRRDQHRRVDPLKNEDASPGTKNSILSSSPPSPCCESDEDIDASIVRQLVGAKAAITVRDHMRWTALHYAVSSVQADEA